MIVIDDLGFELLGVDGPSRAARPGSALELEIQMTTAGLDVSADFSTLDGDYVADDETVVDLGDGRYRVSYTLSNDGGPETGVYAVPIVLTDSATGKTRLWAELATVAFTPVRRPAFTVVGDRLAEFIYVDPAAGRPLTPEAEIVPGSLEVTNNAIMPGETTTLSGEFDVYDDEVRNGTVTLFLGESGANGVFQVSVAADEVGCWTANMRGVCRYAFSIDLQIGPLASELIDMTGPTIHTPSNGNPPTPPAARTSRPILSRVSVGVRISKIDPILDSPLDITNIPFEHAPPLNWLPNGLPYDQVIRGHVDYRRNVLSYGPDNPPDPHYGDGGSSFVATPLAATRVEVRDGCGAVYVGSTCESGAYEVFFNTQCPHLVAEVFVQTESTRGSVRADVRDTMGSLHEYSLGTFTPNIAWVQVLDDTLIPILPAAKFDILQQLIQMQRWSKALLGDQQIGAMPWAHSIYERDWCPTVEGTSEYSSGTNEIRICSGNGVGEDLINRDEFDQFVILHEAFHWFHDHFLIEGLDTTLYSGPTRDFLEGFAATLPSLMLGTTWRMERVAGGDVNLAYGQHVFIVESLDFNGNTTYDDNDVAERWLPLNLWGQGGTPASTSGGWAWRMLWDIADPEEPTVEEPHTIFNRGEGGPIAGEVTVDFDGFGSFELFTDVITGYLHPAPAHPDLLPLDDRGFADVDMVEFLDGVICRSEHTWNAEVNTLVDTVMDFQQYDPATAPMDCP